MEIVIISKATWSNDLERFILAAIAASLVVDDVVCLGNWKNCLETGAVTFKNDFYGRDPVKGNGDRLISRAVDYMDYRLICVMKMENINIIDLQPPSYIHNIYNETEIIR